MYCNQLGRKLLLLLCTSVFSINVYAQYTEEEGGVETENGYLRYIGIGGGATYQVMNDPAISPIVYSRVGALPMLSHLKLNDYTYSEISLRASSLNLTHNTDKPAKVYTKTRRALLDYRYLVKLPMEMRYTEVRVGGMLSAMFAYKQADHLVDAAKVYEYALSLGLCGKITRELSFGDKTGFLTWDLAIPFFANISRPYYLNREELADPDNKPGKDFFDNSATGTFGKFFRLNSRAAIMYRLNNGNMLQFAYQWDYTRMKTIHKAYFAEHIVSVTFMFNY